MPPKRVFLLGSGTSAATLHPANAPTSADFGRVLAVKVPDWSKRFPFLDKAVWYLSQQSNLNITNWALDTVWNGIDENFKLRRVVGHRDDLWPDNVPGDRRLYTQCPERRWDSFWLLAGWELKRALAEVYGAKLQSVIATAQLASKWIAKQFRDLCPEDTIVTTNYDLLVETIAREVWPQARSYLREQDFQDHENSDLNAVGPVILKLHGSLDWIFATSSAISSNSRRNSVDRTEDGLPMRDPEIDLHEDGWERRPLLVPPVKYKDEMLMPGIQPAEVLDVLTIQWSRFTEAITAADELRVFGYRFPAEDAYGNRLLQEAARSRRPDHTLRILLYLPSGPLPDNPALPEDQDVENRLKREIFFRPGSAMIFRCGPIPS